MSRRTPRARRVGGVPPPDRRFRRSRARGERSTGRIWLERAARATRVGLVVGGLAWAGAYAYTVVTASAWFSVQHLRVHGTQRLSTGEVTLLLDGLYGSNAVVTPLEPWRERLLASPWVKDASLRRVLPDAIDVVIEERVPVAIARVGRALQLVDVEGSVVDDYGPRYASLDLPLLEGWEPDADAPQAGARTTLAAAALQELAEAGLLWRVSQLDVSKPHDLVVTLNDDATQLHLGSDGFAERLQSYLDMAGRLRTMVADLEYVDLRFDDRVYIRPRRAGTTFAPVAVADGDRPPPAADDGDDVESGADAIPDDMAGQE
jgi:cell division protein FtsQ